MSRGLGRVQRDTLAILREELKRRPYLAQLTSFEITARVYRIEPGADGEYGLSDAQRAAVRRALLSLRRRGLVFRCGFSRSGWARWMAFEPRGREAREDGQLDKQGSKPRNFA